MKKKVFIFSIINFIFSLCFAEKYYKSIIKDEEEISKWMNLIYENEYDTNGNCIHSISNSKETTYKYDTNNNLVYECCVYSDGYFYECSYKYDQRNNKIYEKSTNSSQENNEIFYEYDSKNRKISEVCELSNGDNFKRITTYDESGVVHTMQGEFVEWYQEYTNGIETEWKEIIYDKNYGRGKQERLIRYNEHHDVIYDFFKSFAGQETVHHYSYQYNENNDVIFKKTDDEDVYYSYDYEYNDMGKIIKKTAYSTN